jgi:hypothetical protein
MVKLDAAFQARSRRIGNAYSPRQKPLSAIQPTVPTRLMAGPV